LKTPRSSLVKRSPRLLLRSATGEESTARAAGVGRQGEEAAEAVCMRREAAEGEVLWRRGGESTASEMVFLEHGELLSELDESDSHATEMVHPGNIMGDYSFLASEPHTSTVTCRARCTLLVLDRRALDTMLRDAPQLAFALAGLTIRYLGHRTARVSNRIWESHCVPV